MELFRIILLGLCAASLALLLKSQRPELALMVSICGGLVIIFFLMGRISELLDYLRFTAQSYGIESEYIATAVKLTGIAFLSDFAVNICKDAGEGAIASKVELAGKVTLIVLVLPVVGELLQMVASLLAL